MEGKSLGGGQGVAEKQNGQGNFQWTQSPRIKPPDVYLHILTEPLS